jgi:hypothetical protein
MRDIKQLIYTLRYYERHQPELPTRDDAKKMKEEVD